MNKLESEKYPKLGLIKITNLCKEHTMKTLALYGEKWFLKGYTIFFPVLSQKHILWCVIEGVLMSIHDHLCLLQSSGKFINYHKYPADCSIIYCYYQKKYQNPNSNASISLGGYPLGRYGSDNLLLQSRTPNGYPPRLIEAVGQF